MADVETAKRTQLITDDGVINWTLQVGAFNTHEEAVAFSQKVKSKGFPVSLEEQVVPGLGTRHQVRSGLYDTYNEAQAQLRILEKALDVAGVTVPIDITTEQ